MAGIDNTVKAAILEAQRQSEPQQSSSKDIPEQEL